MVKCFISSIVETDRLQQKTFQAFLQRIDIQLVNGFLNSNGCAARNDGFQVRKNFFTVDKRNLLVGKSHFTHIILAVRLIAAYYFQVTCHQQKAVNGRGIFFIWG